MPSATEQPEQPQERLEGLKVFNQMWERIGKSYKKMNTAEKPHRGADLFLDEIKHGVKHHLRERGIPRSDEITALLEESIRQPMVEALKNHQKDQECDGMYKKLYHHVTTLVRKHTIEPVVAQMFLLNLRGLKGTIFYDEITQQPATITKEQIDKEWPIYSAALDDIINSFPEEDVKEQEFGGYFHFNSNHSENSTHERVYISADPNQHPAMVIRAWNTALRETQLEHVVYFKIRHSPFGGIETIVIYPDTKNTDEQFERLLRTFMKKCPQQELLPSPNPTAVHIGRGISLAVEPTNINKLFQLMDLRQQEEPDKYFQISYNQLMAGLMKWSFELSYLERQRAQNTDSRPRGIKPKDLVEKARQHFIQLLTVVGIDPETMMANARGKKLPQWAEHLRKESQMV